jgi:hypothetical protein
MVLGARSSLSFFFQKCVQLLFFAPRARLAATIDRHSRESYSRTSTTNRCAGRRRTYVRSARKRKPAAAVGRAPAGCSSGGRRCRALVQERIGSSTLACQVAKDRSMDFCGETLAYATGISGCRSVLVVSVVWRGHPDPGECDGSASMGGTIGFSGLSASAIPHHPRPYLLVT